MNIDRIDLYLVRFPLSKPYIMADTPLEYFDTVLLRMQGEGLTGWSEVFPGNEPTLTSAWSKGVFDCVRGCLFPRLGRSPRIESGEHLESFFKDIKGNRHAKALLDLAWWDLHAKAKQVPLHQAVGGVADKEIEVGLTFDRPTQKEEDLDPNLFLAEIHRAVDDGFKRITLKIRPGWDLQVLGAVRNEFPTLMIQCDVEGSLNLDRHGETIYRFDDFMPALLEQPLPASEYVGHAMLQDALRTTIGLDESITSPEQAEIAVDLRSAGTFCLKPGKVGGLTQAKNIHNIAAAGEIDCYVGADIMTSIGYRFVAALASLTGVGMPTDYVRFDEHLDCDPGVALRPVLKTATRSPDGDDDDEPQYELHPDEDGNMVAEKIIPHRGPNVLYDEPRLVLELWTESGIGFEPDVDMIERHVLQTAELES